jgi:cytochrome c556
VTLKARETASNRLQPSVTGELPPCFVCCLLATIVSQDMQEKRCMRIQVGLALAIASAVLVGGAVGQDDPIAARQAIMKANNSATRDAFGMASGKTPYDAAAAAAHMSKIASDMETFVTLFPEGSDQGDTEASPAIWQNIDDFKALAAKLAADTKAAADAAPGGIEAFKAALNAVGGDCQACHQKYRM